MKQRRRTRRRGRVNRRGAVMYEFAVVLPILLWAIVGILEFGRALMVQQILINAAREGARRAIVPDANEASLKESVTDYLEGANEKLASNVFDLQVLNNQLEETELESIGSHQLVAFRVTVPYEDVRLVPLPNLGMSDDMIMGATVIMRRELQK